MDSCRYPDWLHEAAYDDGLFGAAYGAVSAPRRALLKTCIARLHDWYGPSKTDDCVVRARWRQGFRSAVHTSPRKRCAVLLDDAVGPAALLAALMPARSLGVEEIVVVFVGESEPSAAVLTALELAGQELVVPAGSQLDDILALHVGGSGCVLSLGQTDEWCADHAGPVWYGPARRRIAVCLSGKHSIDREALVFAHPEAEFAVLDDVQGLSKADAQAIFISQESADKALGHAPLVFGPGHEACWLYPDLSPEFFLSRKIALF